MAQAYESHFGTIQKSYAARQKFQEHTSASDQRDAASLVPVRSAG